MSTIPGLHSMPSVSQRLQSKIQSTLARLLATESPRGFQVAAYLDGELVVDACAGVADHRTGRLVTSDTLFPVYSVSKGLLATVIHRLVERGELAYDSTIAEIWPEFAAAGKDRITLRQVLNHTAGLAAMPVATSCNQLGDWPAMCGALSRQHPAWPPGSRADYHAITLGWLLGEPASRVTGLSFGELFRREIISPLALDGELYLGLPPEAEPRVAFVEERTAVYVPPNDATPQAIPAWMQPLHALMNRPDMRRACLPSVGVLASARAIARHYAALLPGGVDGVELLPCTRLQRALEWQKLDGPDTGYSNWLLGYKAVEPFAPGTPFTAFGHAGYGGAIGYADNRARLAVAMPYDPPAQVANYTKEKALPFNVMHDGYGEMVKAFGDVNLTPTTFIFDAQGNRVQKTIGELNFPELRKLLDQKAS